MVRRITFTLVMIGQGEAPGEFDRRSPAQRRVGTNRAGTGSRIGAGRSWILARINVDFILQVWPEDGIFE
jgi:hypothetical protein